MRHSLYFCKLFFKNIFHYPKLINQEVDYDLYWENRKGDSLGEANNYQTYRGKWIAKRIAENSSVLDIACGDGAVLNVIMKEKNIRPLGTDVSQKALDILAKNNIESLKFDLLSEEDVNNLPEVDHVLLLEILEHLQRPEKLLLALRAKTKESVFFSFPNTGYIQYRLRLLFGRFPLQWRTHPGEHIRFWTHSDLVWWLKELGLYEKSTIHFYEGVPFFKRIWKSLFAKCFIVEIKSK